VYIELLLWNKYFTVFYQNVFACTEKNNIRLDQSKYGFHTKQNKAELHCPLLYQQQGITD